MHTFRDPHTGIRIHHNGDYSGDAVVMVPLARPGQGQVGLPAGTIPFALTDPEDGDTSYGIELHASGGQWFARITLPAMTLVRFAGTAMHDAITRELEQMDLGKILNGGSL